MIKPARPTSLELPAQPSVLIGSNLISPETPRPQKAFRQTYINGHAYTYLGLKVSTRSTYCCIYRPQPMFVLQETDPRLSMYSNWIMFPYRDELQLGRCSSGYSEATPHPTILSDSFPIEYPQLEERYRRRRLYGSWSTHLMSGMQR